MQDINSICGVNQAKDAQSPLQWLVTEKEGKTPKMSIYMPCI